MRSAVLGAMLCSMIGCAAKLPCYGLVGVNPPSRTAIIFDQCTGEVIYQTLPPMSLEKAPS